MYSNVGTGQEWWRLKTSNPEFCICSCTFYVVLRCFDQDMPAVLVLVLVLVVVVVVVVLLCFCCGCGWLLWLCLLTLTG